MPKPDIADLEKLVTQIIFPFYQVERHTPLRFAQGRNENDAEHSWSLALFACALAPAVDPKLDGGKVCQYAVVHDLVEVYAGDTSNFAPEAKKATKDAREQEALRRLQKEVVAFPWITDMVQSYELQDTPEARFVKSVDKVIVLLMDLVDEGLFYKENKISAEVWQATMKKHREKASKHPGAFEYYEQIWDKLLANPQYFHRP